MSITERFSLMDFLAYFFPGIIGTLAIYVLLLLTPLSSSLTFSSIDVTVGILILSISHTIGVILSGFSSPIVNRLQKAAKFKNPRANIPFSGFENDILKAFNSIFDQHLNNKDEWNEKHYNLCRALVLEYMPSMAQIAQRQSSLGQLRRNLIAPILLWAAAGIGWGIRFLTNNEANTGVWLILLSLVLSFATIRATLTRTNRTELREVEAIFAGLIVGNKTNAFSKEKTQKHRMNS